MSLVNLLSSHPLSVTSPDTHKQIGPFWCWFLGGWVCVHSRTPGSFQWTLLLRMGVSPATATPQIFTARGLEALLPCAGTLGCTIYLAPSCSSQLIRTPVWDLLVHQLPPSHATSLPLAAHLHPSYPSGWMFLLRLLGCQSSIQFNFLEVLGGFCFYTGCFLLLVVWGNKAYLPTPPS